MIMRKHKIAWFSKKKFFMLENDQIFEKKNDFLMYFKLKINTRTVSFFDVSIKNKVILNIMFFLKLKKLSTLDEMLFFLFFLHFINIFSLLIVWFLGQK